MQAAVLAALCDGLLGTHMVRGEINAREERGMWAAGPGGVGGAFPMRSRESREKRAAAAENGDEVGRLLLLCMLLAAHHVSDSLLAVWTQLVTI